MSKVYISIGHGGSDPGAVGYIIEKDGAMVIATACKDYLIANNVEVKMSRYSDKDQSLTEKINICNEFNPDLAADIHLNAGNGDGAEVFHSIVGGKGKTLAENILNELVNIGQNSRGIKTKINSAGKDYFGFIRSTKAPAVIVESFFVDNAEDVQIGDTVEEQKRIGEAIAKGFLKVLGITSDNKPVESVDNHVNNFTNFVKKVQRAIGAKVDGIPGPETFSKTVTISRYKNSRHAVVRPVQEYLMELGFPLPNFGADGNFGDETETAVFLFQQNNDCVCDGEITARNKTWKKLLKLS